MILGTSIHTEGIGTQLWQGEGKRISCEQIVLQGIGMDLRLSKYTYVCVMCIYIFVCVYIYIHVKYTYIYSQLFLLRRTRSKTTSVAMSIHNIQIQSLIPLPTQKEFGLLGKMTYFWTGAGQIQDKTETSRNTRK